MWCLVELVDCPLTGTVLPLVCLSWPVEPDQWDEPRLIGAGPVGELSVGSPVCVYVLGQAIVGRCEQSGQLVSERLYCCDGQPYYKQPNIPHGSSAAHIDSQIALIIL